MVAAFWVRYVIGVGPSTSYEASWIEYQGLAILVTMIMIATLAGKGMYQRRMSIDIARESVATFNAATTTVAIVIVVSFMLHQFDYSRGVLVYLWIFLTLFLIAGRLVARSTRSIAHHKGVGVRRLLVIGGSDAGKMVMQSVKARPDLGYEVVGFVDRRSISRVPNFGRFQRLGSLHDLPELLGTEKVDDVVVALPGSAHEELSSLVALCERRGVGLKLIPDTYNMHLSRVQVDEIAGIPLLDVRERPIRTLERATKRFLDVVAGVALMLLTLPIISILAVLIRLDSEGPAFIRQERLGKDGTPFTCYKLRSMYVNADQLLTQLLEKNEAGGPIFKMRNDPRCTRVGRYLRRLSLDELPQIWNVVLGSMSLVGPRPPLAREVVNYEDWQFRRLEVKPGITGIWQVSGRSNLTFDEMVMMDIMYVDSWSPILDLKILVRTAVAVVAGRGAY